MYAASVEPGRVTLVLSINEVRQLNNALNEVVNGVAIPAASFETRLGGTREARRRGTDGRHAGDARRVVLNNHAAD